MNLLDLLIVTLIVFFPPLLGYGRRLDHWTLTKIWMWLGLLPVLGWFVAMAISISEDRSTP